MRIALFNDTNRRASLLGLANELNIGGDGWVRLAPYGDHEKIREVLDKDGRMVEEHFIQRITPENAKALANSHNGFFGKLRRLRLGTPIFRGHADRWQVADQEGIKLPGKSKAITNEKLGMFSELQARADGLYGLPVFADDGRIAIENDGLKYFSPFWWADIIGEEVRNGIRYDIAVPVEFISAALTANPNISGGHALSNENGDPVSNPQPKPESTMKKKLVELLRKYGVALANEEDATIEAGLEQIGVKLDQRTALENEQTTAASRVTALENERDTFKTQLATEQTAHTGTRTALENESTEANRLAVDLAIAEGRIMPSERDARMTALKTGGITARKALLNEAPRFKVTPITTAARKEENKGGKPEQRPSQKLIALANAKFDKGECKTFEEAYATAKTENPDLVTKMEEQAAATAQ